MRRFPRDSHGSLRIGWAVWIFPVIALAVAGKVFWEYRKERGQEIRVLFDDASGIQAEKTQLRFRGVVIGRVNRVTLADDGQDVVAHIVLQRDMRQIAVNGSKFTLVVPKVGFQGIQGLDTIFAGPYISVLPGTREADPRDEFRGQIGRETSEPLDDTVAYSLETAHAESISVGDPVVFRGLKIGAVTKVDLSKTSQSVLIVLHVQRRFVRLIRENTFFWKKQAIQAQLGLFKSEVKISSLDSLINSGIELASPDQAGPIAKAGTKFPLWAAAPKDWTKWNPRLEF